MASLRPRQHGGEEAEADSSSGTYRKRHAATGDHNAGKRRPSHRSHRDREQGCSSAGKMLGMLGVPRALGMLAFLGPPGAAPGHDRARQRLHGPLCSGRAPPLTPAASPPRAGACRVPS